MSKTGVAIDLAADTKMTLTTVLAWLDNPRASRASTNDSLVRAVERLGLESEVKRIRGAAKPTAA